jgi:hypothetical protein
VFSTCTQENKSPHPNVIKGCQSLDGEMKDENGDGKSQQSDCGFVDMKI